MTILGVTGGIGSGKSTVCKILENRHARVYYADDVARELMVTSPSLKADIIQYFGEEAYCDDGALNKKYLASRVFGTDEDRYFINSVVHPAVAESFKVFARRAQSDGVNILVKEAALLLDTDTDLLDFIVVVDAPHEERVRRVIERDGDSEHEVLARMRGQMSVAEMRTRADYIIDNTGKLTALEERVDELIKALPAQTMRRI